LPDLSRYRGPASAILAAGVVALAVIGGAKAISDSRGRAPKATPTTPAGTVPIDPGAETDAPGAPQHTVPIKGLAPWKPPKLPKPLKLKPLVRHGRKVVTLVSSVPGAAPAAPAAAAPSKPKAWPKATPAKPRTAHPAKKPAKQPKASNPPAGSQPPAVAPKDDPAQAPTTTAPIAPSTTPGASAPPTTTTTPTTPPPPPPTTTTPPPPPTVPTGSVAITGGKIAGTTVTATWAGADPAATTYQWQLCDHDGNACQPMPDEVAQHYALKMTDIGKTIRVSAVSGSYSSTSRATDQIERGG
jgi:hypothetical protein